jgi:hypothetical protein
MVRDSSTCLPASRIARADREHDERGGEIGRVQHMREAVGEARIEDDRQPVHRIGDAVAHLVAGRRLHPAIGRKNPERRHRGADRDHGRRQHMQPRRHAVPAEQHDAEERRFEEERGQHLVADQRSDHVARDVPRSGSSWCRTGRLSTIPETTPIANDTAKILVQKRASAVIVLVARPQPHHQQRRDIGRQPDREAGKMMWKATVKANWIRASRTRIDANPFRRKGGDMRAKQW